MAAAVLLTFSSCQKQEPKENVSVSEQKDPVATDTSSSGESVKTETEEKQEVPLTQPVSYEAEELEEALPRQGFSTTAHQKFLQEPFAFSELPDGNIGEGSTAVVGSRVCKLYPAEAFTLSHSSVPHEISYQESTSSEGSIKDEANMGGVALPFASIVKITGERLWNSNARYEYLMGMFEFEDNWNWFYPVEYEGQTGYVFGADLYGLGRSSEENRAAAALYRSEGKLDKFYPMTGLKMLDKDVAKSLAANKLAIQDTPILDDVYPDDMIRAYQEIESDYIPRFITTDLAAHSQHLIFDRLLQYTEENFFAPKLLSVTGDFISALSRNSDAQEDVKKKAIQYFQVAEALLKAAPERVKSDDDWSNTVRYVDKDVDTVLAGYDEEVQAEVRHVLAASGERTVLFNSQEDFSQYKPRGHYTKNGVLKAYFRAEMWYGRIHFVIATSDVNVFTDAEMRVMMPVAMFIIDTVRKNPELYTKWAELFDPITSLIGLSDDLGFGDVLPLWKAQGVENFTAWAGNEDNLVAFIKLCHEKLRPPAIQGNTLYHGGASEGSDPDAQRPPMGWRFLGQRFTFDSFIHDYVKVTPARADLVPEMANGLEIMKAFGSQSAESFLADKYYKQYPLLKKLLNELERSFAEYGDEFWNQTYYNQVLYQIKTQATFEQGAGFYFTESPLWNVKAQISAHGTWAELRHDTILYVKQSYAEKGGGGDMDPTFRTLPLPKPVHYVEPNVPFWQASLEGIKGMQKTFKTYKLLDRETENALDRLYEIYERCLAIAVKEAADEPISDEENSWIPSIPNILQYLVLVHSSGDIWDDSDQFKMACIADVFTNAEIGLCLETAVGRPYCLYVPLNDSQGGKRIAVGFGFSYYEFDHSLDRMTDEDWKKIVYVPGANLGEYIPFWEKPWILSASTASK